MAQLSDRELEAVRQRSTASWNRLVRGDEDEHRRVEEEAAQRRAHLRVVPPAACPGCGHKQWDANDLQPGDNVCTCNDPFKEN